MNRIERSIYLWKTNILNLTIIMTFEFTVENDK